MTTNQEFNELQTGLDEISEFLLSRIKQDEYGFYWDTIFQDYNSGSFSFTFNPSLWNGTGGIAWFFLALFENTKKDVYLKTAEGCFSKIYHYSLEGKISNPSLYDGVSGVIYLGLELFRVTGKNLYLIQALEIYEMYRQKILNEQTEDILIGLSGILIVIGMLYHFTKNPQLCNDMEILVTTLFNKSLVAERGIKWGNNQLSIDSLCGFSHGNSGIGFCLMELGKYFDNKEFIWLAEQAFSYEDIYYDPAKNNWMDLRWEDSKSKLPNLFDWHKNTFLSEDFDINAWAHGASGIGTARISAFAITKNIKYKNDCEKVFERCKKDIITQSKRNYILFSGYGGLSDFLLQYNDLFSSKEALQLATESVLEGLKESRKHGHSAWGIQNSEDLGLMTGTAGIGFSLLKIIKGKAFNSILHPELPVRENENEYDSILKKIKVKKIFFERYYHKTLRVLESFTTIKDSIYDSHSIEEFGKALQENIETLSGNDRIYVLDIFELEQVQINIQKKDMGALCFQTRLAILKKELDGILEDDLQTKCFVRSPFIHVFESKWNWKKENEQEEHAGEYYNVFYSTDQELFHLILDPFTARILQLLENPLSIEELAEHFQHAVEEKEMILEKLSEQVWELLKNFFIRTS